MQTSEMLCAKKQAIVMRKCLSCTSKLVQRSCIATRWKIRRKILERRMLRVNIEILFSSMFPFFHRFFHFLIRFGTGCVKSISKRSPGNCCFCSVLWIIVILPFFLLGTAFTKAWWSTMSAADYMSDDDNDNSNTDDTKSS